jgi:hypothetical protein
MPREGGLSCNGSKQKAAIDRLTLPGEGHTWSTPGRKPTNGSKGLPTNQGGTRRILQSAAMSAAEAQSISAASIDLAHLDEGRRNDLLCRYALPALRVKHRSPAKIPMPLAGFEPVDRAFDLGVHSRSIHFRETLYPGRAGANSVIATAISSDTRTLPR